MTEELTRWWHHYRVYRPYDLPGQHYPEITLSIPLADHRLVAKYDLLIVEAGQRMTILDWKTTQVLPRITQLQQRMQTKVYRYVCAQAGAYLYEGKKLKPEDIEMLYWFPEFPDSPARLPYRADQFESDHHELLDLIGQIKAMDEMSFRMTTDTRRCQYCSYRSYCGTSQQVGSINSFPELLDEDVQDDAIDFEQIAEIEF
jgi:hypothetical protein